MSVSRGDRARGWADGVPICGPHHHHVEAPGGLGGRSVLAVPSTYVQPRVDFGATRTQLSSEPSDFAVHALVGGGLVSDVQHVP